MPVKETGRPFPLIDADPHAARVVRYMRPSDYAAWGGIAAAGPAALYAFERFDPTRPKHGLGPALRLTAFLSFVGGFIYAYQNSSFRFMGFRENAAEVKKDMEELSARAKAGKPLYGETDLTDYLQGVAARNSTFSQLKLHAMPWFNFVNHNQHGVDVSKYGAKSE